MSNQKSLILTNQESTTLIASIVTIANMEIQIVTKDPNWPIRIRVRTKPTIMRVKLNHLRYHQHYHRQNRLRKNQSKREEIQDVDSDSECHHGQSLIIIFMNNKIF